MNIDKGLSQYYDHLKEISLLRGAKNYVSRDLLDTTPSGGRENNGLINSHLTQLIHQSEIEPKFVKLVDKLYGVLSSLDPHSQRSIVKIKNNIDKRLLLPPDFMKRFSTTKHESIEFRNRAKEKNDFNVFAPKLGAFVEILQEYTSHVNPSLSPFDVMADVYEEGATQAIYDKTLMPLKDTIVDIIGKDFGKQNTDLSNYLDVKIDDTIKWRNFLEKVAETIGLDFSKCTFYHNASPAISHLGVNDFRMGVDFHKNLLSGLRYFLHELGHGLHESNTTCFYDYTNLSRSLCRGINESQARFLEVIVGKSDGFIAYILPLLIESFEECKDWTFEGLRNALNTIEPGLIRIDADEVSYNLHVLLRYEIDVGLMNGTLQVDDIKELWNERMREYLGVVPSSDIEGCLQDAHWSRGAIGDIEVYMLGNIIAGQLLDAFSGDHPNWQKEVSKADFSSYTERFEKKVRQYGGLRNSFDAVEHATGEILNDNYYKAYLAKKYGQ